MIIISPPSLRSKGREKQRTYKYTKHRQNAPDRSPRPRPSSSSLRRTFCRRSVCVSRQPAKETERERQRKGFVVTKLELNSFPKRKGLKKVENFQSCFFFKCCCYKIFFFLSLYSILSLRRATSSLNFLIDGIISRAVFDGFQVPAQKKLRARGKRVCILRPRHAGLDDGF